MKKIIAVIGTLIFLGFLIWRTITLITSDDKRKTGRPGRPPVAVEVDSIHYGAIREIRQLIGTIYPQYQYIIAPKVAGRILEIRKRIGDRVKSGETVARIDDAEYQQGVLEAEANLRIAEATLKEAQVQFELARQEKERVESLKAKGISSSAELDAAVANCTAQESRLGLARAQVEQRRASLKSARIRLSYTLLTASQAGYIGERYADEGALLAPNSAVVSIVGIDAVIVRTTVIERDYSRIKIGQSAEVIVDAFPAHRFFGNVTRIAPLLQEATRVAQMEVEVANADHLLKPGMFARVEVITAAQEYTQMVRNIAVVNRDGQTGVYRVDPEQAIVHFTPVVTGIVSSEFTEILTPSLEGLVVTLGQHLLDDQSPILLPRAGQKAG